MGQLILSVAGTPTSTSWRWLLSESGSSQTLAYFDATLDSTALEYEGFTDLYGFVRWRSLPDRPSESEAELVAAVGRWIGSTVLGGPVARALVDRAPVTARVELPPVLEFLRHRPLELAEVDGTALSDHEVSLVHDTRLSAAPVWHLPEASNRELRMLAVFSHPAGGSVLALRRERYGLQELVRELRTDDNRLIHLEVLQYGVTRQRLAERANAGPGWDIIHLSGHGAAGAFLLERPDGTLDRLSSIELVELLMPAGKRLKLAVVSACESGAAAFSQTFASLKLSQALGPAEGWLLGASGPAGAIKEPTLLSSLAGEMTSRLRCPVLAMRYPVGDTFAIKFADQFYRQLWVDRLPVDAALRTALATVMRTSSPYEVRPLSRAVPTLFGAQAIGLVLSPQIAESPLPSPRWTMAGFPNEPRHFVGCSQVMADATAVLAPRSGRSAVLIHGMTGVGKTTCAVELAYRHEATFEASIYWQVPENAGDLVGVFELFEKKLMSLLTEQRLLPAAADRADNLLADVEKLVETRRMLLVVDGLEQLLSPDGSWRDSRWASLFALLTSHRGPGRAVFTSRKLPMNLTSDRCAVLQVNCLSLAEAILLTQELPNLKQLLEGPVGGGHELVGRVLAFAQGHPQLLQFAEVAAADRSALAARLAQVAPVEGSNVYLQQLRLLNPGKNDLAAEDFLTQINEWTHSTALTLPRASRVMLEVLSYLEPYDRRDSTLELIWDKVWAGLGLDDRPPAVGEAMKHVIGSGLVHIEMDKVTVIHHVEDGRNVWKDEKEVRYHLHPLVVDAVRRSAVNVRTTVDSELTKLWIEVARSALHMDDGTSFLVHAGLSAAPYLARLRAWAMVRTVLAWAVQREIEPKTLQVVISYLRRAAEETQAPDEVMVLAQALRSVDPQESEQLLRDVLADVTAAKDDLRIDLVASALANVLRTRGRPGEALEFAEISADHAQPSDSDPFRRLTARIGVLAVRLDLGMFQPALDELPGIRRAFDALAAEQPPKSLTPSWLPLEYLLALGEKAAGQAEDWGLVLELNQERTLSQMRRHAPLHVTGRTMFDAVGAFMNIGMVDECDWLLIKCQEIFERIKDTDMLGKIYSARAFVEYERGRLGQAIDFEQISISYAYRQNNSGAVQAGHHILAGILLDAGTPVRWWLSHGLAAELINYAIVGMIVTEDLDDVSAAFRRLEPGSSDIPATFEALATEVGVVPGVDLARLVSSITGMPDWWSQKLYIELLNSIRRRSTSAAAAEEQDLIGPMELVVGGVVAAANGDTDIAAQTRKVFAETERRIEQSPGSPSLRPLFDVLDRIMDGELGYHLLDGLRPPEVVVARRVLDVLSGKATLDLIIPPLRRRDRLRKVFRRRQRRRR